LLKNYTTIRNYSISTDSNGKYYRLSIKREASPTIGDPAGIVSTYMHDYTSQGDLVKIGAPFGHFFLKPEDYKNPEIPLVLISNGIGLTPMVSMLRTVLKTESKIPVYYLHGCANGSFHALKKEVQLLASKHSNLKLHVTYSKPLPFDVQGRDYDSKGRTDVGLVKSLLSSNKGHFYFCGSTEFMLSMKDGLAA